MGVSRRASIRGGGQGTFIQSVTSVLETFYGEVAQELTAWTPRAPRLPESQHDPDPEPDAVAPELESPVSPESSEDLPADRLSKTGAPAWLEPRPEDEHPDLEPPSKKLELRPRAGGGLSAVRENEEGELGTPLI